MPIVGHAELEGVVNSCAKKAYNIAHSYIVFNEGRHYAKALMLSNLPDATELDHTYGYAGKAVILSVDLRGSSKRALRIGAQDTFVTMHTFLPTMAFLVGKAGGTVVGLRGDGLFATFGLTKAPSKFTGPIKINAACRALSCGTAMLETTDNYIDPALEAYNIEGRLDIGVGIAVGSIVVTRIGWEDAQEVTAYGPAVNIACKFRGINRILVTENIWNLLPDPEDEETATILGQNVGNGRMLTFTDTAASEIGD